MERNAKTLLLITIGTIVDLNKISGVSVITHLIAFKKY